ncbi:MULTISPECIES: hypothetical protein [unclassified Caballeronia]|uniref:hypothetical protein n=1 Tax=unclassified Caballeronia TaxID=2646786 RepID=UPI002861F261|nr:MULTISPECIES: hypothetical protein [unclassified Caballeronia]MDR5771504.1 hypothetical protein [Caballeronia sp. LZ002]MDR5805266.1 hypothetical protein [Caballeronia sp. LZ001]MDR5846940.1 hypothetical protein [Caballeronia sp. LZ003]
MPRTPDDRKSRHLTTLGLSSVHDPRDDIYFGRADLQGDTVISFYGKTASELLTAFVKEIDDYLARHNERRNDTAHFNSRG